MKRGEILDLYEILGKASNDLNVVYAYVKLEPITKEIEEFRVSTIKKLAKPNHDEIIGKVNKQIELDIKEVDYLNKFSNDFTEIFNKYLDEDVDIELPKIDIEKVIKESELTVPQSAFLIKVLKDE